MGSKVYNVEGDNSGVWGIESTMWSVRIMDCGL